MEDSLKSLDFEFQRIAVVCKTAICKVETEIRFGAVAGEQAQRLYIDATRQISDFAFRPVLSSGGRLNIIDSDLGPVTVHYLYSRVFDPTPPEVLEALRSLPPDQASQR